MIREQPIRCLVIQFARLGDSLQSLMALRAAKQLYPNLELTFVTRERFAAAAKRVSWIHNVVTFPSEEILGPVLNQEKTDIQALGDLARWVSPLVKESWDLIVNWSYSESSSYLTGLLPAKVKLGYSRRKDTSFCSLDGWSHYIQAIVQGEIRQNIHITDILTTQLLTALQIHFGEPADNGDAPVTSKSFFTLETTQDELGWCWRDLSRKWIAIQLGSARGKHWSAENWASLMHQILKRNPGYSFVLLGSKREQEQATEILSRLESLLGENPLSAKHVLPLVGETDFDVWASIIGACQWLISSENTAVHLASVLGTRVLHIALATDRWSETGPYGNGHYIVAPQDPAHPGSLLSDAVYAAWSYGSLEWSHRRQISLQDHAESLRLKLSLESARIFRAKIRGTQDGGGVFYEPLSASGLTEPEWMSMVVGHIARAWYCGWVPPVGQELQREKFGPGLIQKLRELDESAMVLSHIYNEASVTALTLNKKSAHLKSDKVMRLNDRDELRELGNKLIELDTLIDRLGKAQPALLAFIQMSKVLMHNLEGDKLSDLGKETASCYRQLNEGVSILKEWLKYSLQLAKPVAVPVPLKPKRLPEQIL